MSIAPKTAEAACMERKRRYCRRKLFGKLFPDCISNRYAIVIISMVECYRHKNVNISIIQYGRSVFNRFFYFYVNLFQRRNFYEKV